MLFQEHNIGNTNNEEGDKGEWWRSGEDLHEREAGELTRQEFNDTLSQVLGTHAFDHQLDVLFSKVSANMICTY